jgi:hypothetical protein
MNEKELALDFAQFFEPMINSVRDNGAECCNVYVSKDGIVSATFYECTGEKYNRKLELARNCAGEVRVIREEKLEVSNGL